MHRTIVIIHPGTLGDILLSLAAIRQIRHAFPVCDLALLAQGDVSRLLFVCGEVQAVFPIEARAFSLLVGALPLEPDLDFWLRRCDLAVAWMRDPEERLRSTLLEAGAKQVIVQSPMSSARVAVHQEDRFMETIETVGHGVQDRQRLALPSSLMASAKVELEAIAGIDGHPLALFHPGSGSLHKCGAPEVFAAAIAYCQTRGLVPVVVEGPADGGAVARVIEMCTRKPRVLQHESLLSIAGVLAQATMFIGNDSGLSHLAARLHVPMITVFGPTDPRRWAPRGPEVTVLTGEACRCEGWEAVRSCLQKPCLRVPVDRLLAACEQTLKSQDIQATPVSDCLVMSEDLC
ncbi:MAG: glycosyltransferase family 9 protein [Nitrospiraceae bacterium]